MLTNTSPGNHGYTYYKYTCYRGVHLQMRQVACTVEYPAFRCVQKAIEETRKDGTGQLSDYNVVVRVQYKKGHTFF